MKILIRNEKSARWDTLDPISPKVETDLQKLISESPYLVPIDEIREGVSPLAIAVREFGLPGSGNSDIVAFTTEGDIVIIECKLANNPESKRKVIGQILEYAAYLWKMSYQELDQRVQKRRGKSLCVLVKEAVADENWDKDIFQSAVEQSLNSGAFLLVIVVDNLNDDLRHIITYVNECSTSGFSLHALEVRRFEHGGVEILVPQLHGLSTKPTTIIGNRKKWDEDEFFNIFSEKNKDIEVLNFAGDLYNWSKDNADRILFGTGIETGSFTFHYLKDRKTISVFTLLTTGRLTLNFPVILSTLGQGVVQEFHSRIITIPAFRKVPANFAKYPSLIFSEIVKSKGDVAKFEEEVLWLREKIEISS